MFTYIEKEIHHIGEDSHRKGLILFGAYMS